ncbi:tryptophan-rich sensory protein [Kocuria soli]|uniref:Tryptophan-rich sensory protein n=2 Tax=Kocuria soli TaxID=2485125 RepID=A0A3N3ZSG6_9MICC|nr:tryptophan-rich sensory protein [Kocuria soli]
MRTDKVGLMTPILTLVAVAVAILGAFLGSGAIGGTPVTEAVDGWLAADATPVAPGASAFSIWSLIYLGLGLYALWQLTPRARSSDRQRRLRPWAVAAALLNALWLGVVQLDGLFLSVVVILVLLVALIRTFRLLMADPAESTVEAVLTDGTFGLYLGWLCVATVANITAWLGAAGLAGFEGWRWAAAVVVLVAAAIGIALVVTHRNGFIPGLAIAWGVAWIADARMEGQWESPALVWTAAAAAGAVLVAILLKPATHRAPSGRQA